MLEFIFFHHKICKIFTDYLAELNIAYRTVDDDDNIIIAIADELDDARLEQIEDEYERLLDLSRQLTDNEEADNAEDFQKVSLQITLQNGATSYAHVDMDLINRVLRSVSLDELNQFVASVVDAVEHPDERSYCQILKDGKKIHS
jgi:hypothetical protein